MPSNRRFRSRCGGSARVKTTWNNLAFTFGLSTLGVVVFAEITPVNLNNTGTLLRSIISFSADQLDPVLTVPQEYAIGIAVQTRQAIDNLEILEPLANMDQDWYYWTGRTLFREGAAESVTGDRWEVDLRSKRRLRGGYGLVITMEPAIANLVDIDVTVGLRQLWAIDS